MDRLREVLTGIGCTVAETLGTTGNAVIRTSREGSPLCLERAIEEAIARRAGLTTDAFVRDWAEWEAVVSRNPFTSQAVQDPAHLVVTVLRSAPTASAWRSLSEGIVGREKVLPGGRHAYIIYPDGIGRSKLTAGLIERLLGVRATSRNWNTVLRLREELRSLAGQPPPRPGREG